jgi:hypothetical protein
VLPIGRGKKHEKKKMKRTIAVTFFLGVCLILALLLLTKTVTPIVSGLIFAFALVIFGGSSRSFRGTKATSKANKGNAA